MVEEVLEAYKLGKEYLEDFLKQLKDNINKAEINENSYKEYTTKEKASFTGHGLLGFFYYNVHDFFKMKLEIGELSIEYVSKNRIFTITKDNGFWFNLDRFQFKLQAIRKGIEKDIFNVVTNKYRDYKQNLENQNKLKEQNKTKEKIEYIKKVMKIDE